MRVLSVNTGLPRTVAWKGRMVQTGIFKEPVAGRCTVRRLNLDGDRQADLTVHGGPDKAVYAYPAEHYEFWRDYLGVAELPPGSFGENLTTDGLTEENIHIGDRFRIGTAEFVVTQPRQPCYKLAVKFGRSDLVREFLESGYSGFYLAVVKEGDVGACDPIQMTEYEANQVSIAEVNGYHRGQPLEASWLRRAAKVEAFPPDWREAIQESLAEIES